MRKIYIVFEQIPRKEDGGLVATYVNFVNEFRDEFHITFVSIFKSPETNIEEFKDISVITIINKTINNRFYKLFSYIRERKFLAFLHALESAILFFGLIPYVRSKTKKLFSKKDIIIAPAPASAMFISSKTKFILEIHINFEYFWGNNLIGRLQTVLMAKPTITVFRNSVDAKKGSQKFPSTYIYNCFDDNVVKQVDLQMRKKHSAIFVGRLAEQKQPFKLLDFSEQLKKIIPDFTLDIYGEGPLGRQLKNQIMSRGLQNTVFMKGFTTDKSVYREYDVAWLTSSFEGFGLVIIEAMANCVPTISTEWGEAVWEIIENEKTGVVAKTDEAFIEASVRLLEDTEYRNQLAANARMDYEKRFSPERHKASWEKLFQKVYG